MNPSEDRAPSKRFIPEASSPEPGLYLVATPIGNLGDITLRALWVLAKADLILCEDTRVTGAMLHRYGIARPLLSYHDHNAQARQDEILEKLQAGQTIAQVSDAGTPLISDPGFRLVGACRAQGLPVFALPGASAVLTALVSVGLPTDRFFFAGFLPPKKAARRRALEELADVPATLVFYESPQRVAATMADMAELMPARSASAYARELTKLFEEVRLGTPAALAAELAGKEPKGEFVLILGPPQASAPAAEDLDTLLIAALETQSLRDAVASVTAASGARKADIYARALALSKGLAEGDEEE